MSFREGEGDGARDLRTGLVRVCTGDPGVLSGQLRDLPGVPNKPCISVNLGVCLQFDESL